jgi:prophage regulatory protein
MASEPTLLKPVQNTTAKPATPAPQLPETGFLRLNQIVGDKDHPPIIPVGKTTWWNGCKTGKFPKPVKLGQRTTAWRVEDIRALVQSMAGVL